MRFRIIRLRLRRLPILLAVISLALTIVSLLLWRTGQRDATVRQAAVEIPRQIERSRHLIAHHLARLAGEESAAAARDGAPALILEIEARIRTGSEELYPELLAVRCYDENLELKSAESAATGPVPLPDGLLAARLGAGWRSDYITSAFAGDADTPSSGIVDEDGEGSLFERILHSGRPDEETYILKRGPLAFAILNAYPYNSGHLMVLPNRAVPDLEALTTEESAEVWGMVREAVVAIKAAYAPQGVNVGMNLGHAAGAGVPDHLHVHCLPRWCGDTNFVTTVAEIRVLPEPLGVSWERLRAAWPA